MATERSYIFRGFEIPPYMFEGIENYLLRHIEPGQFLAAVICNDLQQAVAHADNFNLRNLPAYVGFFYNEAPSQCWGSKEKMERWLTEKPQLKHFEIKL